MTWAAGVCRRLLQPIRHARLRRRQGEGSGHIKTDSRSDLKEGLTGPTDQLD